jgi:hypothetical protein
MPSAYYYPECNRRGSCVVQGYLCFRQLREGLRTGGIHRGCTRVYLTGRTEADMGGIDAVFVVSVRPSCLLVRTPTSIVSSIKSQVVSSVTGRGDEHPHLVQDGRVVKLVHRVVLPPTFRTWFQVRVVRRGNEFPQLVPGESSQTSTKSCD